MRFDIDLNFTVDQPLEGTDDSELVHGTVTAEGRIIHIKADSDSIFRVSRGASRPALGQLAHRLKNSGIQIVIDGPNGNIATLGDVKPNLTGRLAMKSNAVRFGSMKNVKGLLQRDRRSGSQGIPSTLFPLFPTFQRNQRMRPTTTHYADRGGRPRLIFVKDSESWDGKAPKVLNLVDDVVVIGSAQDSGLILEGLEPVHARIVRDDLDEYVLQAVHRVGGSAGLNAGQEYVLRSGARIELGGWRLVFYREEYADHGRPYGGRNGGELAYQRPQVNPRTGIIERDSTD